MRYGADYVPMPLSCLRRLIPVELDFNGYLLCGGFNDSLDGEKIVEPQGLYL